MPNKPSPQIHPDEEQPKASLCQSLELLRCYHENCVAFYSSDQAKCAKHTGFLRTVQAAIEKVCKKKKLPAPEVPTLQEVQLLASEIGLPEEQARIFYYHYESVAWNIGGKKKVKNWQARLRLWKEEYLTKKGGSQGGKFDTGF